MKKNILLFAFLFTITAYSQKLYKAKLTLVNGETKEGYADIPSNSLFSKTVIFSIEEKGKKVKFKNDEIDHATYYTDNGNEFYFERTRIRQLFGEKEWTAKQKIWIVATYSSQHLMAYSWAQSYYIDSAGTMVSKSADSGGWADIFICFKRPGEEFPSSITSFTYGATVIGQDKRFRKSAILYFKGEDVFNQRIENKEWTHEQIYEMAKAYSAYKGN